MSSFEKLVAVMALLREADGCPWDREQTHVSLKPYLIEEAYEVIEAIDSQDDEDLKKELGDLLLQVVFHAQLATEEKRFNIEDVLQAIVDKLIARHPHVFGEVKVDSSRDVLHNWERIKQGERKDSEDNSALKGIPKSLPALLRARRIQEKASHLGFDWDNTEDVIKKVKEEVNELKDTYESKEPEKTVLELGDLLFSIVNLARFLKVNPEEALNRTSDKFIERFRFIEQELEKSGRKVGSVSLSEMDELWEKAKLVIH